MINNAILKKEKNGWNFKYWLRPAFNSPNFESMDELGKVVS